MEWIEWTLVYFMVPVVIGLLIGSFIALIFTGTISIVLKEESRNKAHFYVARDKYGILYLYLGKPTRGTAFFISFVHPSALICRSDMFDSFGLKEKDYANLKWEDDPVEVFVNMED